jgi:hypothetical protein
MASHSPLGNGPVYMPCRPEELSPPTHELTQAAPELEPAPASGEFLKPLKPLFDKFRGRWTSDLERPMQHYLLHFPSPEKLKAAKPAHAKGTKKRAAKNPWVNKDPFRPVKRWGVNRETVDENVKPTVFSTLLTFPPESGKYFPEDALEPVYQARRDTPEVTYVAPLMDIPVTTPTTRSLLGPLGM